MGNDLVQRARQFWYNNTPGPFVLGDVSISRRDIQKYGGPSANIVCPVCQEMEWKSRIAQQNLFREHSGCSKQEGIYLPQALCAQQGDEMWTHRHQDFSFSLGCDSQLDAPKCLYLFPTSDPLEPVLNYARFVNARNCDFVALIRKRQIAQAAQVECHGMNYSGQFDYALVCNMHSAVDCVRPDMPLVLSSYDPNRISQATADHLQPDYLLTPCPTLQAACVKLPAKTEVVLWPQAASSFFTRPNLGEKKYDLMTIGTFNGGGPTSRYWLREVLNNQLAPLVDKYRIVFFNNWGTWAAHHGGPTRIPNWDGEIDTGDTYHYLNMYSDALGLARYVTFAPLAGPSTQLILAKHFECLGSGAIPILHDSPDRKYLGIEPHVHYIPFSEIDGNNEAVEYYLSHYADYRHIAVSAVAWYKENVDRMMFDDYEDFIRRVTEHKYPKRLIDG